MDRRDFLRSAGSCVAIGLIPGALGACLGDRSRGEVPAPFRGMDETQGLPLQVFQGASEFLPGTNRIPLALTDADNRSIAGAEGHLWVGRGEQTSHGYPLNFNIFASPEHLHDPDDPKVFAAEGFYDAEVELSEPGFFHLLVNVTHAGNTYSGYAAIQAVPEVPSPEVGEAAVSLATPTFGDPIGFEAICTRTPPCPLHQTSLDQALANPGPVVLTVATPALCTSRVCGPVVDELVGVSERIGGAATFIHAEVFRDLAGQEFAPIMDRWGLDSEPWVFLIDASGVVRHRFEGPVVAEQIEGSLRSMLR